MMTKKSFSAQGMYISSFFQICLDVELQNDDDFDKLSQEEKATFVHEYIHFLQSLSTTSGISRINFTHQILQYYLHETEKCDKFLKCPIKLSEIQGADVESDLESYYDGYEAQVKINHINRIKCEPYEYSFTLPQNNKYNVINVYYDEKEEPYVFGRICVMESMAYIIEKLTMGGEVREKEFPYNACEILCEHIFPRILKYENVLVAMCELSLMHYNSGEHFYHILMDMKNSNKIYTTIDEFSSVYINKCDFLWDNYELRLKEFIVTVNHLYKYEISVFKQANRYLNELIIKMQKVRCSGNINNRSLFISYVTENHQILNEYLATFGTPFVIDKNENLWANNSDMLNLMIPYAVFEIFTKQSNKCPLYSNCIKVKQPLMDDSCLYEPWEQSIKDDKLCPFGAFWYMFSLEGKKILKI